jgi:hypothetical protein
VRLRDLCFTNIILPAVNVVNALLTHHYDELDVPLRDREVVTVRAQYSASKSQVESELQIRRAHLTAPDANLR